jgi:hypothetical protein
MLPLMPLSAHSPPPPAAAPLPLPLFPSAAAPLPQSRRSTASSRSHRISVKRALKGARCGLWGESAPNMSGYGGGGGSGYGGYGGGDSYSQPSGYGGAGGGYGAAAGAYGAPAGGYGGYDQYAAGSGSAYSDPSASYGGGSYDSRSGSVKGAGVQLCADFQRGRCMRDNCRYVHDPTTSASAQVCNDFLRGRCMRESCRFLHQAPPVGFPYQAPPSFQQPPPSFQQPPPQSSFSYGGSSGSSSAYGSSVQKCADFARGRCMRSSCKFMHDTAAGAPRNPSPFPPVFPSLLTAPPQPLSCRLHGSVPRLLLRRLRALLFSQPARCARMQRLPKRQVCASLPHVARTLLRA